MTVADYSEEDAQAILRRALESTGNDPHRFSHDELRKAAEEVGVTAPASKKLPSRFETNRRLQGH